MDARTALQAWARSVAAGFGSAATQVEVTLRESGAIIALTRTVVIKVHPEGTDVDALTTRLAIAGTLPGVLARPLTADALPAPAQAGLIGRVATVWPRLRVLAVDTGSAPWVEAARTLAALHLSPVPSGPAPVPACGAPARLLRAVERLERTPQPLPAPGRNAARAVAAAGHAVLAELGDLGDLGGPTETVAPQLVHGDWHLGQLAQDPATSGWSLLDVDDLGLGDPAWDLGRPAGFWAAGLLDDASWQAFLAGYRAAGGPAVPTSGDPWPRLDRAARAAVVIAAARELRAGQRDPESLHTLDALVAACAAMPR